MKIISPCEDRVIIELSEADMRELDITYEDMDYSTVETRRVIWTVLDKAEKVLGRELDPSRKMSIEAAPKVKGGCVLLFTMLDNDKKSVSVRRIVKKRSDALVCEFNGLDALFQAAEGFKKLGIKAKSGLYERGGKYLLIVETENDARSVFGFFSEFAETRFCDDLFFKSVGERWKPLISNGAFETLLNC